MVALVTSMSKSKETKEHQSVRVPPDVLQMVKIIVAVEGGMISEILADHARPSLRKKVEQLQKEGRLIPPSPKP